MQGKTMPSTDACDRILEVIEALTAMGNLTRLGNPDGDDRQTLEYKTGTLVLLLARQLTEAWCDLTDELGNCTCGAVTP
jgi:hypothetical protein